MKLEKCDRCNNTGSYMVPDTNGDCVDYEVCSCRKDNIYTRAHLYAASLVQDLEVSGMYKDYEINMLRKTAETAYVVGNIDYREAIARKIENYSFS